MHRALEAQCAFAITSTCLDSIRSSAIDDKCPVPVSGALVGRFSSDRFPQVQEALDQLQAQQKRTTLTVAHRLTTIRNSDKIAVLNNGGVQELGTHDELLALKGLYSTCVLLPHVGVVCLLYRLFEKTTVKSYSVFEYILI